MNLFDWDKPALKITNPVRLIELFAGIGAQAKALERLGVPFEHYKVVEIDRFAVASYNAIHGTDFAPMDITKITAADLNIVDTEKYCYILTYSFPCQDLSKAGASKGLGKGTRSGLLWEVDRILHECKEFPQVLLMENVSMIVSWKHINDFAEWVRRLEELGYTNMIEIMNAKDFGVPQNRERCFMVSFLGDYQFEFPKPIPLTRTMGDTLEPDVEEKYYLNEETANNLCSQLVKVERERERERESNSKMRRAGIGGRKAHMGYSMCRKFIGKPLKCSYGILARYYKGLSCGGYGIHLECNDAEFHVRGVHVKCFELVARCFECGEEIYIPTINDWNVDNREWAYQRAKMEAQKNGNGDADTNNA